jgi:hypothetical protein
MCYLLEGFPQASDLNCFMKSAEQCAQAANQHPQLCFANLGSLDKPNHTNNLTLSPTVSTTTQLFFANIGSIMCFGMLGTNQTIPTT